MYHVHSNMLHEGPRHADMESDMATTFIPPLTATQPNGYTKAQVAKTLYNSQLHKFQS